MRSASVLAAMAVIAVLAYAGWRVVHARESHSCGACRRPVHADTRTVAMFQGKRAAYCCPACALWQSRQTGGPLDVRSLSDYGTGKSIAPEAAFLVRGSDVAPCAGHTPAPGLDKQPVEPYFDRCSPSLLAFGSKASAEAFAATHGGQVLSFADAARLW